MRSQSASTGRRANAEHSCQISILCPTILFIYNFTFRFQFKMSLDHHHLPSPAPTPAAAPPNPAAGPAVAGAPPDQVAIRTAVENQLLQLSQDLYEMEISAGHVKENRETAVADYL